jgi:hypothetical protein
MSIRFLLVHHPMICACEDCTELGNELYEVQESEVRLNQMQNSEHMFIDLSRVEPRDKGDVRIMFMVDVNELNETIAYVVRIL